MDRPYNSAFSRALKRTLQEGTFTAIELADVAGCSRRHIDRVANGQANLQLEKAENVSRYLCSHDETRCTDAFSCPEYAVERRADAAADGQIMDEVHDLVRATGHASHAHEDRDAAAMNIAIRELKDVLARIEAERDRIKL